MNDVKLTDFTAEQLQVLLVEVVAGIKRLEQEGVFTLGLSGKRQDLILWRTQILNAISTVQRREQITNS